MKKLLLATVALTTFALPANADGVLSLGFSQDGAPLTVIGPDGSAASITGLSTPNFSFISAQATTQGTTVPPVLLDANTLDIQATATPGVAHFLDVFVTAQNISGGTFSPWLSTFSQNRLTVGWATTFDALVDSANGLFTGTSIGSNTFTSIGIDLEPSSLSFTTPFSVTAHWHITNCEAGSGVTCGNAGQSNSATTISAVPGPIVGAGLPGILAMMGMGGWTWRKRRKLAKA